jgi:hypothetical protein
MEALVMISVNDIRNMTNFKLVLRFSNFGIFIELFSPCYGLNRGHQYEFLVTKYKFKTKKIQSGKRNEKNFARLELFLSEENLISTQELFSL